MRTKNGGAWNPRRGGALVAALVIVFALASMAAAVFSMSIARSKEANEVGDQLRAFYMADSGVTEALSLVAYSVKNKQKVPSAMGNAYMPLKQKGGEYWYSLVDNMDGSYTVTSSGDADGSQRAIEAVIVPVGDNWYDHALHAGNTDNDPTYTMGLGGTGADADEVTGDIYSGGDIALTPDAGVNGDMYATGTISGGAGTEGVTHPTPDIIAMDYPNNHDVDVAGAFSSGAENWRSDPLGGSAWELPEDHPAHIFRKNPDDRTTETNGTAKDDYFLEDPYNAVTDYTAWYGGKGHTVTLSDPVGTDGNEKVYFIDGNLWVHNKPWGRMRFKSADGTPVKITFVVMGNVYISDDITFIDQATEGMAIITIKDPNEPDSGNLYMGDPRYGTVERIEAFMFAENNFIDLNLSATGSKHVTVSGNMTAGNKVAINRDFVKSDGTVVHSKLTVNFDDRLSKGTLDLPGIPLPSESLDGFAVAMWREVAIQ